ncbi:hypothetical protein OAM34_01610 [Alphaproteobacteria bacterium]|nr:hypothetical protein [Alphaproteobacteria bacterium]
MTTFHLYRSLMLNYMLKLFEKHRKARSNSDLGAENGAYDLRMNQDIINLTLKKHYKGINHSDCPPLETLGGILLIKKSDKLDLAQSNDY